ncbi:MAG: hypothetical protein OXO52_10225 [Rhodospirillales bacterium]|nr:hypothetical protein [Rhodospirillales bacterium]MDE0378097.1 hypothetical protein [Rhodospirillales bacterium]
MLRRHRTAHAYMWKALAIFLPAMLIAALAIRQHGPTEKPAVQLEKPAAEVEAPAPKSDEQGGG